MFLNATLLCRALVLECPPRSSVERHSLVFPTSVFSVMAFNFQLPSSIFGPFSLHSLLSSLPLFFSQLKVSIEKQGAVTVAVCVACKSFYKSVYLAAVIKEWIKTLLKTFEYYESPAVFVLIITEALNRCWVDDNNNDLQRFWDWDLKIFNIWNMIEKVARIFMCFVQLKVQIPKIIQFTIIYDKDKQEIHSFERLESDHTWHCLTILAWKMTRLIRYQNSCLSPFCWLINQLISWCADDQ